MSSGETVVLPGVADLSVGIVCCASYRNGIQLSWGRQACRTRPPAFHAMFPLSAPTSSPCGRIARDRLDSPMVVRED